MNRSNPLWDSLLELMVNNRSEGLLFEWKKAQIYKEAKNLYGKSKFVTNLTEYSAAGGRLSAAGGRLSLDKDTKRKKLAMCAEFLTEDQFVRMGLTNSIELMVESIWLSKREQMQHLASIITQDWKRAEVREAKVDVQRGVQFVEPAPPPKTTEELLEEANKKLDQANVVISILRGEYVHSDESFFHPDEHLRQMQIDELNKGSKYSCLFFGITKASEVTEEIVKAGYRKLSKQYHPDRGGSQEIMTLINKLNDHFGNIFSLK